MQVNAKSNWFPALGAIIALFVLSAPSAGFAQEVLIPESVLAGLEVFEQHELARADKVYTEKKWRQSAAEYDGFILQFPRSPALPYAILREARSLQQDGKRFEAIKKYTDVIDYFPNAVDYAAPASFFIGQSNFENGDVDKAIVAWTKLADDKQYSKHPVAAAALTQLSNELARRGNWGRAVEYYKQVAVDFRTANPPVAQEAINQAIFCYIRIAPSEPKLREFYIAVKSFDTNPRAVSDDNAKDQAYWGFVQSKVASIPGTPAGAFNLPKEADARKGYYLYWAKNLSGKFADWDDYQITIANFQREGDGDSAKWTATLDAQFKNFQKEGDFGRIVKWIQLFGHDKPKANEYYGKLTFDKMTNPQIAKLVITMFDPVKDVEMARNTFQKLKLGSMPDNEKQVLFQGLWNYDPKLVLELCMTYEDKDKGKWNLVQFYWGSPFADNKKALDVAQELLNSPAYASQATMYKGHILQRMGKYAEAIAAFQQVDKPEETVFYVSQCYVGLSKLDQAVATLREAENFLKDKAPEAGLRIAHVWRDAGGKDPKSQYNKQYIATLRAVLAKYPKSQQSSTAHLELEAMGITKTGGGDGAE
jgi:TolA-binding protein